ncbi:MAG TPA: ABC transporter permease [Longimicrobiales bacterium]|nr:ABC transporter permease [Longimicrobiales bacterium]
MRDRGRGLMALAEGIGIALDAISANKLRAALTILGVGIGVSVVVTIAALITGVRTSISSSIESSGPDNFNVMRFDLTQVRLVNVGNNRPPWWGRPVITDDEAERIDRLPGVAESLYQVNLNVSMDFEGERVTGIVAQGLSAGWPAYSEGDFTAGRDFTDAEVGQGRPIMVITAALAEELFGQRDPIGRTVRVSSPFRGVREDFRVIGVFEPEENIFSSFVEHFAVFPYTTALKRLKASQGDAQIVVVPRSDVPPALVRDEVIAAMRSMRGLGPRDENNFDLLASTQFLEFFDQFTQVFFLIMLALSSAGLMVGGVGVIGIMLISVTERTREIGVRKALGATRREILWQFLVEAGVLTMLGAAVGLGLGAAVAYTIAELTPVPARIPLWSVVVALTAAAFTGMVFGIIPAQRAARMEPVDALRAE